MRALFLVLAGVVFIAYVIADNDESAPVRTPPHTTIPREVTIDAAFRYGRDLFLISGNEYMAVAPDGLERYLKVRSGDTGVPTGWPMQAAVHWPLKPAVYYYGSDVSIRTNQTSMTAKMWPYNRHREFLQDGGPDAAAFKAGWFYLFKGCQYVKQVATLWHLGEPETIADIHEDLPCDIDAAWTSVDRRSMTILKGDQIWLWTNDGVSGPFPFKSEYTIWSWKLKPSPEESFEL